MKTKDAEDLLAAVAKEADDCHDSPTACCHVLLNTAAGLKFREVAIPVLAVAIKLAEAAEASKEARLATGRQSTCDKQVHGDSHIQCGKCFICLECKALAAWGHLGE